MQRSLEEQIAALKQQLSVSGQGESAGPSAEPASGATATDAVADVPAVAGSPFKVLIDLGEDASGDGLQVHVQLDGQLISSKWSDENLFFRHPKMDPDLEDHPEWIPYVPHFDSGCPFSH